MNGGLAIRMVGPVQIALGTFVGLRLLGANGGRSPLSVLHRERDIWRLAQTLANLPGHSRRDVGGRNVPRSTLVQVRTSGMSATDGRRACPGVARRPGVRADLRLLQTWEGARRSRFERLQVDLSRDPTVRNPLRPSFYRFLCASLFLGGRINNDRTITTNNRLLLLAHVRLGLPRRRSLCANGSAARRPYQPHSNAHAGPAEFCSTRGPGRGRITGSKN
jgi:hypothetical protein